MFVVSHAAMEQDNHQIIDGVTTDLHVIRTTKSNDKVTVEDVVTQDKERDLVDNLLSCSAEPEEDYDYLNKIVCNDWTLAVHGWEDTRPYVKYAWGENPVPSKKRDLEDGGSKRVKAQRRRQIAEDSEDSWRRCVEPRTYRYVYDPKGLHRTTLKFYNGVALERAVDEDGFTDHILKLREYLEKTLTHAKKETSNGIKERANLGQYCANKKTCKTRKEKRVSRKLGEGKLIELGEGLYLKADISSPEDEEDARLTFKGIEGKRLDDGLTRLENERQATPILPVRHVEKQNFGQLSHHTKASESPTLSQALHSLQLRTSATSSYEKFPTQSVGPPDLALSPLKKVTPHQRQIHDDNEVLSHDHILVSKIPAKPSSAKSEPDHSPSYKVLLERSSAPHLGSRNDRSAIGELNGTAMNMPPPMRQFPLVQELAAVSKLLKDQDQKNKNKGKRAKPKPFKLGAGYLNSGGDAKEKLGDPLHRGVMDRETAGAMAAELLPGVSGHKLNLPAYSQRIL